MVPASVHWGQIKLIAPLVRVWLECSHWLWGPIEAEIVEILMHLLESTLSLVTFVSCLVLIWISGLVSDALGVSERAPILLLFLYMISLKASGVGHVMRELFL